MVKIQTKPKDTKIMQVCMPCDREIEETNEEIEKKFLNTMKI